MKPIAFDDYWMPVTESGCWLWMRGVTGAGYGAFKRNGRSISAHRYSYELHKGPIPAGLELDHLCRVRICVNPDHLEPVTAGSNVLRGVGITAENRRKTACSRGHAFDEKNTYATTTGGRACRQCKHEWYMSRTTINCCLICYQPKPLRRWQRVCDECKRKAPQEEFRKGFAEMEREALEQEVGR